MPLNDRLNAAVANDASAVAERLEPISSSLAGARILVTGASGLIGSLLVRVLLEMNEKYALNLRVVGVARNADALRFAFVDLLDRKCPLELCVSDVKEGVACEGPLSHIVHAASPTSSRYFVQHPVDTIETAYRGTRNMLEFAREKRVRAFLYLSSLEVYGTAGNDGRSLGESEAGLLDSLSVRSSYSESKRLCETLCMAYASEYEVPAIVARLSQTFGAGVRYQDGRVFAEFMRCALEGRPVVLHSEGKTTRTYCSTKDAVEALVLLLTRGRPGEAYNVANEDTVVSIYEMANLVSACLADGNLEVRRASADERSALGYNPELIAKLDSSKLRALGWIPQDGLEDMFLDMAACFE